VVVKVCVLPTQVADIYEALTKLAETNRAHFSALFYAIGIGMIYVEAAPAALGSVLQNLRVRIESLGGSLVIAHRPDAMKELDGWGNAGDALALMRAVKKQFDPKATLNPGRFVGGI
jgi:glycolate oxidase FAD binding subunit